MAYKVIVWGAGGIGAMLLREIIRHPDDLQLAGVKVYSAEKNGKDAAGLAGLPGKTGVLATTDRDALLKTSADVVLHAAQMRPDMTENHRDVIDLLSSGKNVISVAGYVWPYAHGEAFGRRFEDACKKGRSTLFGTGIHPGFLAERLTMALTGVSVDVERVHFREIYDCSEANAHMLKEVIGFGKKPKDYSPDSPIALMFDRYFHEVLHCQADVLGVRLDKITRDLALGEATRTLSLTGGVVEKGTVAGVSWSWKGWTGDVPFLTTESAWICDRNMAGWGTDNSWTATIYGRPEMKMTVTHSEAKPEGIPTLTYAIGGPMLRAIPEVCAAAPGLYRAPVIAPFNRRYVLTR